MRAAPTPSRIELTPIRQAAIQPSTAMPTKRLLDRRMGTPSARHTAWLGRYQDWQWDAKRYARTVGVVRFAANLVASTAGRCTLIVEQRDENGDWVETEDQALKQLLALYGNETFGQTANELVRLHTWHYQIAGEAVICNRDDNQGVAEWLIASMDAVEWDKPQKDLATVRFHPGGVVSDGTAVILPRDQMLRYWMPDEEWLGLATSPLTAVMDDIRRYKSLVRYAQRQAESYLAMNGILWTPEKPHASPASGDVTEHEGDDPLSPAEQSDRIFDLYNEWANMSINDDDSIAAVIPPMMWFGEQGDKPEHIDIAGGLDEHGPAHREEALQDIGRGVDSPMSLVAAGGSNTENHWGAYITQERFIAAVAPTLDRVTHQDMTVAFLYPLMRLMGRQDMRRTRIGYDATPVIVHPDKSDKALRGLLAGVVGYPSTREAMGFDESDAPTPEDLEILKQILTSFGAGAAPGAGGPPMPGMPTPPGPAPGEAVGPATTKEGPPDPTETEAGRGLGLAASVLGPYMPWPGGGTTSSATHLAFTDVSYDGNGGNGHTRVAASLNGGMDGVMIALPVTDDIRAEALADGEDPGDMHMTLLYFGRMDEMDPAMLGTLQGICSAIAASSPMPEIDLSHYERFAPTPDGHSGEMLFPVTMVDDGPDVPALVQNIKAACDGAGCAYHDDHAFRPHVTLGYYGQDEGPQSGPLPTNHEYSPDSLMLHWGDEVHAYPFVDAPEPGAPPDEAPVLASSRAIGDARRAYTFDESQVVRDTGGRFAHKEGGGADSGDPNPSGDVPTLEAFRHLRIDRADMASLVGLKDRAGTPIVDKVEAAVAKHFGPAAEIEDRYRTLIDEAKESGLFETGKGWYQEAHNDAAAQSTKYDVPLDDVIGAYAAISPGLAWEDEVDIVDAMLEYSHGTVEISEGRLAVLNEKLTEGYGLPPIEQGAAYADLDERSAVMAMKEQFMEKPEAERPHGWGARYGYGSFMEGLSIIRGAEPNEALNGVKIRSFYNNIADPDGDDVTVDVMMMRAANGNPKFENDSKITSNPSLTVDGKKTEIGPTPMLADIVRDVAADEGLTPAQAQAIIWLQWKKNTGTL